jgi:hypothetical protein
MSAKERQQIKLMVAIAILFRKSKMGSPTEYDKPLQLLKALQVTDAETDRNAIMKELAAFTHNLIQQYQEPIRAQYLNMIKVMPVNNGSRANLRPESSQPSLDGHRADQAFKRMNEFLDTYPIGRAVPQERGYGGVDQASSSKPPTHSTTQEKVTSRQRPAINKPRVSTYRGT